jgi:hypothetical protein
MATDHFPQNVWMLLDWLVEHGGKAGIWVFATLETSYLTRKLTALVDAFSARILGPIQNHRAANYLSGMYGDHLAGLAPGAEALIRSGSKMIHVLIPQLTLEE